jgi:hypothetical protein
MDTFKMEVIWLRANPGNSKKDYPLDEEQQGEHPAETKRQRWSSGENISRTEQGDSEQMFSSLGNPPSDSQPILTHIPHQRRVSHF